MKHMSSTALLVAFLMPQLSHADEATLPADVLAFGRERESCDHWRGEEPYDAERKIEINAGICSSCVGTDGKLDVLKAKYKQRSEVLLVLNEFEPKIESLNGRNAIKFCQPAYKKFFDLQKKYEIRNGG